MRVRTLAAAGLTAVALAATSLVGTAGAASPSGVTATPSGVSATASNGAATGAAGLSAVDTVQRGTKCRTSFGIPVDDGIISWAGGGLDTSGAADFKCGKAKKKRTIKTVVVQGTFGDPSTTPFNVTVYGNKGGEPDDNNVICSTTGFGTPTGAQYPAFDITKIPLDSKCVAKRGVNWLEVQSSGSGAYYWRTQSDTGGKFVADWRDELDSFGSGCTKYANGRDMENCIFGGAVGQNDFMFTLK